MPNGTLNILIEFFSYNIREEFIFKSIADNDQMPINSNDIKSFQRFINTRGRLSVPVVVFKNIMLKLNTSVNNLECNSAIQEHVIAKHRHFQEFSLFHGKQNGLRYFIVTLK